MIYKDWLNEWLDNYIKPSCKIRTYERYSQIIDKHILGELGSYSLNKITPMVLQHFVTDMLNNGNIRTHNGLAINTVNCIITVLQSSLKTAYKLRYTRTYVVDKILRPKIVEKQVSCFTNSEQHKIENYVLRSSKIKLYGIIICLYTGIRIGELLALTKSDLDLKKSLMTISKTCHDSKHGRIIDSPKTSNSCRVIPLPKQILYLIQKLKKHSESEFLITDKNKPISIRSYQRSFELLLKKLKIEHKGFHSLRHTFATRALECGMDVKTLSEILGHKNPNVTLNRYAHCMFEHKQDMMNRVGKCLQKMSTE